jgi:hypothetical protein
MSAIILNHPAKAAEMVCHDDQMVIWAGDFVWMLSVGDWLKADLSYDDGLELQAAISRELKSIIAMAFTHPELKPSK